MVRISRQEFERLVLKALEGLPPSIQERMDNVDVVVRDWPSRADLEEAGLTDRHDLFGLYQGVPLTERDHYNMVLPDKITIFRHPIEAACDSRAAVKSAWLQAVSRGVAQPANFARGAPSVSS